MRRKRTKRNYFEPQRHPDHKRPVTRREFIGQGFLTGAASVAGGSVLSLFADPRAAYAALSSDLDALRGP
ncbi:MAG: general secretion pathway protein GspF, partial [Gammaproteobacteria bacterium]|nr:general secretion pathway protein GspF [Gammaproteobacteria bacterium]